MLDINLFREDKGHNPELIRESQRRRFASVELVDEIIHLDKEARKRVFELDNIRKEINKISKEVYLLKRAGEDASTTIAKSEETKKLMAEKQVELRETHNLLNSKLESVGNLVHDSVPVSNDEANNLVVRSWGEKRVEPRLKNHVDLVELLDIADTKKGSNVAGGRGYYLKGDGVRLNQALINFGLDFLGNREYTLLQTPFFMRKDIMSKCAQLAQFDEELYKVTGEGDDKYLIATAEQPLCAYHLDDWIPPSELPRRYAGYSTCFRKEAGSHGRDTLGIFRVHQFEKVEQFSATSPNNNDSWDMHEEMLKNSEDFYRALNLPYQVVSIVSGALNDAAAKKYDLEAWFPSSQAYRELVSCSNCTDYQARRLEIRLPPVAQPFAAPRNSQPISDGMQYTVPECRDIPTQMPESTCSFNTFSVQPTDSSRNTDGATIHNKGYSIPPPHNAPSNQFSFVHGEHRMKSQREVPPPPSYSNGHHVAPSMTREYGYDNHERLRPPSYDYQERWNVPPPYSGPRYHDRGGPAPYGCHPSESVSFPGHGWRFPPPSMNYRDSLPFRPHFEDAIPVANRGPGFWHPR